MKSGNARSKGLTLAETIVVCAVFSLLMLTITQLLIGGLRAWRKGSVRNDLRANIRRAIDDITSEFRQTKYGQVTSPLSTSPSQTLTFQRFVRNPTPPNLVTTSTVTYTLNTATNTLQRTEAGSTVTVAENIVYIDPRDGGTKSFFQWADANNTTLYVQLFAADGASAGLLNASSPLSLESLTVGSAATIMDNPVGAAKQVPVQSLATPAALACPVRHPFRTSLDGQFAPLP